MALAQEQTDQQATDRSFNQLGEAVQMKLEVGAPNDKYEQEADAVADRVMMMPTTPPVQLMPEEEEKLQLMPDGVGMVQLMSDEEEKVQLKCSSCEEKEKLQRKPNLQLSGGSAEAPQGLTQQLNRSNGGGQALPKATQEEMGQKIGADFSGVKVHTGNQATQMNTALGARAFTHGSNIYFNQGNYNPHSSDGKHLLAHELTHTVQQGAAQPTGRNTGIQTSIQPDLIHRAIIQREVGRDQVAPSRTVLSRINNQIRNVDASPRTAAARMFGWTGAVTMAALAATPGLMNPLTALNPFPTLVAGGIGFITGGLLGLVVGLLIGTHPVIQNLSRLYALASAFNPGAARDAAGNAFVYTCTGGWIDLGHYFISALIGYLAGYNRAIATGFWMEDTYQRFFYNIARRIDPQDLNADHIPVLGGLIGGNARSHFTIEDMPSDHFGSQLGGQMNRNPSRLYNINGHVNNFFSSHHPVFPTGTTFNNMMEETIPGGIPRQHREITPYLLNSAAELCNTDRGS